MAKRKGRGVLEHVGNGSGMWAGVMENPIGKRAVWTGVIVGAGLLLVGGVAFAATKSKKGGGAPGVTAQYGKLTANDAIACCTSGFTSMAGREGELPSEVYALLTPGGSVAGSTGYAWYQDRLFKWVKENLAGYYECDTVNVPKLRSVSGYSP